MIYSVRPLVETPSTLIDNIHFMQLPHILEGNIVLFNPLHLFDSYSSYVTLLKNEVYFHLNEVS